LIGSEIRLSNVYRGQIQSTKLTIQKLGQNKI
jgi:hypothetical protein